MYPIPPHGYPLDPKDIVTLQELSISNMWEVAIIAVLSWGTAQFVGKPVLTYRKLRAEITRSLILYANVGNPLLGPGTLDFDDRTKEAMRVYRDQASSLMACANDLALYRFWAKLRIVPSMAEIQTAKAELIGLSNNIGVPGEGLNVSRRQDAIRRALRIKE